MNPAPEAEDEYTYNQICEKLTSLNIKYGLLIHAPVRTSEEAAAIRGVSLDGGAKAMLFKDSKSGTFYLAVMSATKRVSWKLVKNNLKVKKLELANEEEVKKITRCLPGAVPPFGSAFGVKTLLDPSLIKQGDSINFNVGLRTHSMNLKVEDYLKAENPEIVEFVE
jgi:Ala-tRNA(Pro) deacylase